MSKRHGSFNHFIGSPVREQGVEFSFFLRTATVRGRQAHHFARDDAIFHCRETFAGERVQVEVIGTLKVTDWPKTIRVFVVGQTGFICTVYKIISGPIRVKLCPELL